MFVMTTYYTFFVEWTGCIYMSFGFKMLKNINLNWENKTINKYGISRTDSLDSKAV
jgi:hypothetical protein